MDTLICRKCGAPKPGKCCNPCTVARVRAWALANPARYAENMRRRRMRQNAKNLAAAIARPAKKIPQPTPPRGYSVHPRAVRGRIYRMEFPLEDSARAAAQKAVKDGILIPEPCQKCGAKAEMHHHKGYEPEHWLDVQWLCHPCHITEHARIRKAS